MRNNRNLLLASILLVICVATAYWFFEKNRDEQLNKIQKIATIQNEAGFYFSVYRLPPDDYVWARFSLPDISSKNLDKDKPPIIWVDANAPLYMSSSKEFQESSIAVGSDLVVYDWKPKHIAVVIWHGVIEEGLSQDIINLMQGHEVKVRYFLDTGEVNDVNFSLKGKTDLISNALDINPKIDFEAQQKAEAYKHAYSAAAGECKMFTETFDACFSRVNACSDKSERDAGKFNECLKN